MSDDNVLDDEQVADEHTSTKRRGRPKNEHYLPWAEAREFIQSELIPSRGKFFEWWDRNKPKAIPRFPYRVYQAEWVSWNDFLGTSNKFNDKIGTRWRPLLEATGWALKLNLKTQTEWMEFCRVDGNLPADIPARPDLVYDGWRSWGHWLGNKPIAAIESHREVVQLTQVYYIIRNVESPGNVLVFGVEQAGLSAMKQWWELEQFEIVRLFWWDPSKAPTVNSIVNALSSPYKGDDRERLVPNVWEVIYYLEMELDRVKLAG